jgi:hypothetical protein
VTEDLQRQVIAALLLRDFETRRLPGALEIQASVDTGEPLATADALFLDQMVRDLKRARDLLGNDPDLLCAQSCAVGLRGTIAAKALSVFPTRWTPRLWR